MPTEGFNLLLDMLENNKNINEILLNDTLNISEEEKEKIKNKLEENVSIFFKYYNHK